jgi:hypothetical protein
MLALLILFISIHLSLCSDPTLHYLMFQSKTPLTLGHSLDAWDSFGALVQTGCTLIGRMQYSPTGLTSFSEHPKAQGLSSLVLSRGMDHIKASCPFPNLTLSNP